MSSKSKTLFQGLPKCSQVPADGVSFDSGTLTLLLKMRAVGCLIPQCVRPSAPSPLGVSTPPLTERTAAYSACGARRRRRWFSVSQNGLRRPSFQISFFTHGQRGLCCLVSVCRSESHSCPYKAYQKKGDARCRCWLDYWCGFQINPLLRDR